MEENKDFRVYRYGDRLDPGYKLEIEHSIVCNDTELSSLIAMGKESMEAMRQGSIDGERKAFDIVVAAAKQWEQQAVTTQLINRALEYLHTPEVAHTGNQWKSTEYGSSGEEISNKVYKMTCSVWEDARYDRQTQQSVPVAWYVTWDLYIHSPKKGYQTRIAGQSQKRYTDKEAAYRYLNGRKKAYAHLFTELYPVIPKQYESNFMVHGTLLPGYTVEGQERMTEKSSVLGQLATVKTQEKSAGLKPTTKKKEDMQL